MPARLKLARSEPEEHLAAQLAAAGIEFEREWRFDTGRRWRVDFLVATRTPLVLYRDRAVCVEIEGGLFLGRPCSACGRRGGGRHNRGASMQADLEKYNALTLAGFRLLRFTPKQVKSGAALRTIEAVLGR